jgi:L-fucose mutarotase/ribose pyranase (RbsD/FucU family)
MFKRGGRYYNFSEVIIALLIAIRHETISVDTGNRFIEAIITKDFSKILKEEMELFYHIYADCSPIEYKWFTNKTKDNHCILLCGEYKKYSNHGKICEGIYEKMKDK